MKVLNGYVRNVQKKKLVRSNKSHHRIAFEARFELSGEKVVLEYPGAIEVNEDDRLIIAGESDAEEFHAEYCLNLNNNWQSQLDKVFRMYATTMWLTLIIGYVAFKVVFHNKPVVEIIQSGLTWIVVALAIFLFYDWKKLARYKKAKQCVMNEVSNPIPK